MLEVEHQLEGLLEVLGHQAGLQQHHVAVLDDQGQLERMLEVEEQLSFLLLSLQLRHVYPLWGRLYDWRT